MPDGINRLSSREKKFIRENPKAALFTIYLMMAVVLAMVSGFIWLVIYGILFI